MASVNYTVRLDESDKKAAEQVFNALGLTLAAGFNVYIKAVVRRKGIPFEMALNPLNDNKMTTAQREAAQHFLSSIQNIRNEGFTKEDENAIHELQNGKYKTAFGERLS